MDRYFFILTTIDLFVLGFMCLLTRLSESLNKKQKRGFLLAFALIACISVPEVLVYMAFVAVANYAQHSYEMGYATKLCRMLLLILIWLFDLWGFLAGIVGTLTLMATTKPLVGKGYLYPLIPFDGKKLKRLLHRVPISKDNS